MQRFVTGLVILLVVAALLWFAWLGPELARGRREQAAVSAIRGFDSLETEWNGRVTSLHLQDVGDAELQQVIELKLPQLRKLKVTNSRLSDGAFGEFAKLSALRDLNLKGTPVNDAALKHLAELTALEGLNLTDTGVKFKKVDALQKSLKSTRIDF